MHKSLKILSCLATMGPVWAWAQEAATTTVAPVVEVAATTVAPVVAKIDTGDTAWVLISTALVLLMTPGLAFFYGGMVRTKSVVSTLLQSFSALGVLGLLWAVIGYTLSFGPTQGGIIGGLKFLFLNGVGAEPNADYAATIPHSAFMLFQCMFAVITPILMTGALAERIKFKSLIWFLVVWSFVVYYPVVHWVWGVGGFIRNLGALDFAGGIVVHMTAGYSALVATILLKSRSDFGKVEAKPYDVGMILLGTTLLWFGWFGFNAGSSLAANGLAAQAFGNTFFASGAAFVSWMLVDTFRKGKPSAIGAAIGAVAGLVAVTPAAGFVTFTSAIIIGLLTGLICNYAVSIIKETFKLDDTLDVFGCHAVGGTLGTILTAFFASKDINSAGADGLFYGSAGVLKANLGGAAIVIAVSVIGTVIVFKLVDAIFGMRVSTADESAGLDKSQHGEFINSNFENVK